MKDNHTPGRWQRNETDHVDRPEFWIYDSRGDHRICKVYAHESASANARLIAAAPQLLEALREIATFAWHKDGTPISDEMALKARAALALVSQS